MHKAAFVLIATLSFCSFGCSSTPSSDDASSPDASSTNDGGPPLDSGRADAGPDARDAGLVMGDANVTPDAGLLANGSACTDAGECGSGECVDGVCCDVACDGECQACAASLTGETDGRCAPALAADPEDECDAVGCTTGACGVTGCELQPPSHVCREAMGGCDVAESCSGAEIDCPPDTFHPAETVCRASVGSCDATELCSGISAECPVDLFAAALTECRSVSGTCDVAETCSGASPLCPTDAFAPTSAPLCAPYRCSGTDASCPTTCTSHSQCASGSVCSSGMCVVGYRMFVTSLTYAPTWGGAGGADTICRSVASAAGLGANYRAWISDSSSSPASRLSHVTAPYYRMDGLTPRIIANDWADLVDGVSVAIATDERGVPQANAYVWTGSTDAGAASGSTCASWSSASAALNATTGNASAALFSTYYGTQLCTRTQHLYCVEQPPPS